MNARIKSGRSAASSQIRLIASWASGDHIDRRSARSDRHARCWVRWRSFEYSSKQSSLRTRTPWARALLPATRCQSSGPLGALLSSPALDVRLPTALQVLQVRGTALACHSAAEKKTASGSNSVHRRPTGRLATGDW